MPFADFWALYPKKKEKLYARKCYEKALREDTEDSILEGTKRYAAHCLENDTEQQFIKMPSTFLNKGCWLDEYEIPQKEYVSPEESRNKARLKGFYERGLWNDEWGPRPERKVVQLRA